jgi:hypothetical protein
MQVSGGLYTNVMKYLLGEQTIYRSLFLIKSIRAALPSNRVDTQKHCVKITTGLQKIKCMSICLSVANTGTLWYVFKVSYRSKRIIRRQSSK